MLREKTRQRYRQTERQRGRERERERERERDREIEARLMIMINKERKRVGWEKYIYLSTDLSSYLSMWYSIYLFIYLYLYIRNKLGLFQNTSNSQQLIILIAIEQVTYPAIPRHYARVSSNSLAAAALIRCKLVHSV